MDNDIELKKRLEWYEKRYGAYIEKRGLGNWRNLFRKPNIYEWTILFMLIMSYFIAWAYSHDVKACHETLNNLDAVCEGRDTLIVVNQSYPELNQTLFNQTLLFKKVNETEIG